MAWVDGTAEVHGLGRRAGAAATGRSARVCSQAASPRRASTDKPSPPEAGRADTACSRSRS